MLRDPVAIHPGWADPLLSFLYSEAAQLSQRIPPKVPPALVLWPFAGSGWLLAPRMPGRNARLTLRERRSFRTLSERPDFSGPHAMLALPARVPPSKPSLSTTASGFEASFTRSRSICLELARKGHCAMLDTISGSGARPAVSLSDSARLFSAGMIPARDRRALDRRDTDRRMRDRRVAAELLLPGFKDRRAGERRLFDRRLIDRRARSYRPTSFDRETLYQEFQPLVRRLIRQYGDCPEVRQDLAGEIYYRFCALLDAYDPARGVPLRPYLVRQLSASVYTYARHGWIRQRREVSYEGAPDSCAASRVDPTRDWDDKLAMEQVLKSLPDAIAGLPKR